MKSFLRSCVRTLFSFEALFVLFLFAGVYKADPRFGWVPVDLTALLFGLSVLALLVIIIRGGLKLDSRSLLLVGFGLVFALYATASFAWTPAPDMKYTQGKALSTATLMIWPLIASSFVVAADSRRIKRFLVCLFIFSSWIAIESFSVYVKMNEFNFIIALGGERGQASYLPLGRVLGLGAVVVSGYLIFFAKSFRARASAFLVFSFYFFVLLVLGGKGPFVAAMISLFVPLAVGWRMSLKHPLKIKKYVIFIVVFVLIAGGVVITLIVTGNLTVTLARLVRGVSYSERLDIYNEAVRFWMQKPIFGHGIGSWPELLNLGDGRYYAHNIILEILSELGLIGLFLFMPIVILSFRALGKRQLIRNDPYRLLLLMMLVNTGINALFSGDLPDNRVLFAMFGLLMFFKREEPALG